VPSLRGAAPLERKRLFLRAARVRVVAQAGPLMGWEDAALRAAPWVLGAACVMFLVLAWREIRNITRRKP